MRQNQDTKQYAKDHGLSVEMKHIMDMRGTIYVTVAGLRVFAHANDVVSIIPELLVEQCDFSKDRYFAKCTVVMPPVEEGAEKRTFVEFGSSVGSNLKGAHCLMSHALTRATGRALRNALDIPLPLAEESREYTWNIDTEHQPRQQSNQPHRNPPQKQQEAIAKPYEEFSSSSFKNAERDVQNCKSEQGIDELRNAFEEARKHFTDKEFQKLGKLLDEKQADLSGWAPDLSIYFGRLGKLGIPKEASDIAIQALGLKSHKEMTLPQYKQLVGFDGPKGWVSGEIYRDGPTEVERRQAERFKGHKYIDPLKEGLSWWATIEWYMTYSFDAVNGNR